MILAAVVLFGSLWTAAASLGAPAQQSAPQSSETPVPPVTSSTQDSSKPSQSPAAGTDSAKPSSAAKRRKHKKQASDCSNLPATDGTGSSNTASNASTAGAATTSNQKPCPPAKVIVRHGGTADTNVQLSGPGAQSPPKQETANQLLGPTEANLKKIEGRQLSSSEQDMVNQIRQFMKQSKAAVVDGDLERARTLAWKSQVLSEELVNTPK